MDDGGGDHILSLHSLAVYLFYSFTRCRNLPFCSLLTSISDWVIGENAFNIEIQFHSLHCAVTAYDCVQRFVIGARC